MTRTNDTAKYMNELSVADIHDRFSNWFKRARAGAEVDEIVQAVSELCTHVPFRTLRTSNKSSLFRGRLAEGGQYFSNISGLWYPPPLAITRLGRANRVSSSILYVSQDGRTAVFEMSPKPGQHLVVADVGIRDGQSLNLQHVGVLNNLASGNLGEIARNEIGDLQKRGYTANGITNVRMIHRLLGEEFMRDITLGNEHEYAVSVAIAEFLLSYKDADGLIFPSKRSPNDYNMAIKPGSADTKLFIKQAYGLEVTGVAGSKVEFRYMKASEDISTSGAITWHSGPKLPPLDWNSAGYSGLQGPFPPRE